MYQQPRGTPHTLAVVRFSAAGDIILTAPVLAALRRAWPDSRLIFVTHERYAPLVQHNPHVHHVVALAPQEGVRSLCRRLRALKVEALCDLHGSWRSRALALGLGLSRYSRLRKRNLQLWAAQHIAHAPYRPLQPMPDRYHGAAEALVGRPLPQEPLTFHRTAADRHEGHTLLRALGVAQDRPMVALLPGAAWATKRWPVAHFGTLANLALSQGLQVLALGAPSEAPLTEAIAALAPGTLAVTQPLPWGTMAHLLASCCAAVAGDTGPMHLARAVGTPCVVLFGSTPAGQFNLAGHAVLVSTEHCSPCSPHGLPACPRGHLRCMIDLSVQSVWRALALTLRDALPMTNF